MAYLVGPKGEIVIEKEIRDWLGVEPGWIALQRLVDDHLEIYLLPPQRRKSLKGSLAEHVKVHAGPDEDWDRVREDAWKMEAQDRASDRRP